VVAKELLEELSCSGGSSVGGFGCLCYGGLAGDLWFGFFSFVIVWSSIAAGMWLIS
jgi:hypothetical protein